MLCPNPECKHRLETGSPADYVEGISVCVDCGTPLVAELAPEPERVHAASGSGAVAGDDEPVDLARLAEISDPVQGSLLRSFLEEAGIGSVLRTERRTDDGGAAFGLGARANVVYVESGRLEEAREILAALEAGAEPLDDELAGYEEP